MTRAVVRFSLCALLLAMACRAKDPAASDSPDEDADNADDAGVSADGDVTPTASDGASIDGSTTAAAAAKSAAETSPECAAIAPFYWEVGDAKQPIASGSVGGTTYTATSKIQIASASKLVWGAYIVERFKATPTTIQVPAMTMKTGYTSFTNCIGSLTVGGCWNNKDPNNVHVPADDGFFTYGGGHFQKYAVDLGLGLKTNETLATEIGSVLGPELGIAYDQPQLAGGVVMAPGDYAHFLRKMMDGSLAMGAQLGKDAVCTLPSSCPQAHESPVPEAWEYSYGHWVETDGTFSSPGLWGFYPWIGSAKKTYGIVARRATTDLFGPPVGTAYWKSVLCGRAIRKAFLAPPK